MSNNTNSGRNAPAAHPPAPHHVLPSVPAKQVVVQRIREAEREKVFDKVLLSVGRKPNSEIPGLDKTQVQVGPRGFIQVNKQLQTDDASIYAIGDVVGEPMLAHKAMHEGRTAAEAMFRSPRCRQSNDSYP